MPGTTNTTPGTNPRLTASFARYTAELHRARVEAGWPTYRRLSRQTDIPTTTVWRILTGKTFPPRWQDLTGILQALQVSPARIETIWVPLWSQLRREAAARPQPPVQRAATASAGPRGNWAQEHQLPGSSSPHAGHDQAVTRECEDCGALIGNLVQHQAWHWRIEGQIPRAPLRAIDGTGQPPPQSA
jgi:hypothetical protein